MDDHFDDFDDDFGEGDFMDDDLFGYSLNCEFEPDDPLFQNDQIEYNFLDDGNDNGKFDIEDSFILGGAMGFAYEAEMNEAERKRLSKKQGKKEKQTKKQEGS